MKEDTKEYIEIADIDLDTSKKSFQNSLYSSSCFWSQQAIELYLKAFLIENNIFNPKKHKIHNINKLLDECIKIDNNFIILRELIGIEKFQIVSDYSVLSRYDIEFIKNVNEEDAKEAIDIAEKVREFIYKKLNIDNNI
ncbi:HEPN domain-containing protein [Nanobdella aerobiophila]|uniref:HEPN domain-containing protein n=1 Tax=Nanobdella aerobiophila TaxID=2586965 RepID=UPI0021AC2C6A|nr:HEPN domain-containing protein [Nanobdella aerobiophila]